MKLLTKMLLSFLIIVIISGMGFGFVVYKSSEVARQVLEIRDNEVPRLEKVNQVA